MAQIFEALTVPLYLGDLGAENTISTGHAKSKLHLSNL